MGNKNRQIKIDKLTQCCGALNIFCFKMVVHKRNRTKGSILNVIYSKIRASKIIVLYLLFDHNKSYYLNLHFRLEQVGEEFCGSESEELQKSVRTQSSNYFKRYHSARLDELRIFLENEVWTPCPVRDDFNLLHLQVCSVIIL